MENKNINSNEEILNTEHISLHQIVWYMVIFSILGLLTETVYGYATTGILESRKGLILGPFCPIYGVGSVIIILMLNKYKGQKLKLFVYGGILGDFVEYLLSYALEAIYGSRFWNYENFLNINGRICLTYTIFWGILSIVLINVVKGAIDKIVNKIKDKAAKILDPLIIMFFIIDIVLTVWATSEYKTRAKDIYYNVKIFDEPTISAKLANKIFPNEIMEKIFPNLRFIDKNENEIMIRDIINYK